MSDDKKKDPGPGISVTAKKSEKSAVPKAERPSNKRTFAEWIRIYSERMKKGRRRFSLTHVSYFTSMCKGIKGWDDDTEIIEKQFLSAYERFIP